MTFISRIRRSVAEIAEIYAIGRALEHGRITAEQASRAINAVGRDGSDQLLDSTPAELDRGQLAGVR